jgi:hypothetical protein
MPYVKDTLISRAGYSGFGSTWDDILGGVGSVLRFYGSGQRQAGAADQANRDLQTALNAQGISTSTLVIGGAAVAAIAFILLRRKPAS